MRLYLNPVQKEFISKQLGCCRFIYNKLLDYKKTQYEQNKQSVSLSQLGKYLTDLKKQKEYLFLNEVYARCLNQTMMDLIKAYDNFFKQHNGYPKFKSKKDTKQSCRFPINVFNRPNYICNKIKGNRITLIKQLKNILFKCSRKDEIYLNKNQKYIHSVTLTKTSTNKYYLSILIDYNINQKDKLDTVIGLDLGIKDFIVDSNGNRYENKHFYKNQENKLKKLNKQLSKKQKGSNNRNKVRIKLSRVHEKIKNQRQYYLHQIISKIVSENQIICIEDLNVNGMMSNHKLAKSIQELSLYEFRRQLEYKCKWYGRQLIVIDRFYPSSKTCHNCGYIYKDLKLCDREWICPHCKSLIDRDYNAAQNILTEGLKQLNI